MQTLTLTEADTSERRGRFLNNLLLSLPFIVLGCSQANQKVDVIWLESTNENLQNVNGIVFNSDQRFTGALLTFYPATRDTAEVSRYLEGKEDGIWRKYFMNGELMQERSYSRGKKTGDYKSWWPNGKKKLHYRFANGEYEGTCQEWNENGRLVQEMNYKNGHEEGSQKMYYDNGKIRSNYTIIKGRRYGLLGTKNCINVADSVFVD